MEFKILINRWRTKRVGFIFDLIAWNEVCKMNGIEIYQIGELEPEKMMQDLIYGAHISHSKESRKIPIKREKVLRYVECMNKSQLKEMNDNILESKVFGKSLSTWKVEGEKKKRRGAKS